MPEPQSSAAKMTVRNPHIFSCRYGFAPCRCSELYGPAVQAVCPVHQRFLPCPPCERAGGGNDDHSDMWTTDPKEVEKVLGRYGLGEQVAE